MARPFVPKFAVPFRLGGSSAFAVVEQDSDEEILQCVKAIVRTPIGSHIDDPELGIQDPTFDGVDPEVLTDQVLISEPRAALTIASGEVDDLLWERTVSMQMGTEEAT